MKSAVAAMGLFAVMANAYHHPRHFHFRRDNTTASADAGLTTLTVIATQVSTITSCAPTVISCPAKQTDIATLPESDKITQVVTNTVILTETVCPVSEVPAISSSVISEADAGSITGTTLTAPQTASVPLSTGVPATTSAASPGEPGEPSNPSLTTTQHVETKSLTITLGTGTDKSTVTSTYLTTVIQTVTCDGGCGGSGSNGGNGGNDKTEEPTTTTTATTTGTTTVTVPNPSATENGTPGGSNGNGTPGNGNGNGNGEGECQPTATVTVTAPASTVYVTVGAEASKTEAAESAPSVTGVVDEDEDDEEDDYEDDDECEIDTTTTLQTTVTVQPSSTLAPFPTGNNGTSGAAAPTGYARLRY